MATDHGGAAEYLKEIFTQTAAPPGFFAFAVADTKAVFRLAQRIWKLAKSLPDEPLQEYKQAIKTDLAATEVEKPRHERIGQNIFRKALMTYWGNACAVTGATNERLLRASHVIPWAECTTNAERLNVHNGILLAAHLDAAFDAGLISFRDDGLILISSKLDPENCVAVGIRLDMKLSRVRPELARRLAWHRNHYKLL